MTNFDTLVISIIQKQLKIKPSRSLLVAISGIDGSGKGYLTQKIMTALNQQLHSVIINLDAWHNPPHQRFNPHNPAEHFYHYAFNFDSLFQQLIFPLQQQREINFTIVLTGISGIPKTYHYQFKNVDIIILEGIFLFKRSFLPFYDLKIWIDCSWQTALQRAIERNQEGINQEQLINDYQTIYFPAQTIHLQLDQPQSTADLIYLNDSDLIYENLQQTYS
jgi:uridine kinase